MHPMKGFDKIAVLMLICFFFAQTILAEEKSDTVVLPELNIVAIKQAENLNGQPVSFTKVGMSEIQLNEISDIKTLSDIVPNFYIPVYGSRITSSIYVRGIGARMDQPSVGMTIDNMPVLNKDAYDLDVPEMVEVEMLRGPQSALYGRNTMAGLINIRTLSSMRYQGWRLMGEAMLSNSYRLQAGWYHKFSHDMGFSASIGFNSIHGDYRNNYNNSVIGSELSGNARIKFEWLPTTNLSILNTFSTSLGRQNGYAYEFVKTKEINYNDTCFYKRFLLNDVLTLNYDFNELKLSGIMSVQHINDNMTLDQDFLPLSYFTLTQKKQETDLTAEILAQRTGNHKYHWLSGVFAFYRHLDMQAPVTFKADGIKNLIEDHSNSAIPNYPIKWDSPSFVINSDFKLPSFGVAIYHESKYNIGNWKFTGALRLDYERITMHYNSSTNTTYTVYKNPTGNPDIPFSQLEPHRKVTVDIDDNGTLHVDYLTLLPKVSALYELGKEVGNIYLSFGKGYKAGGYNTQMFSDVLQQRLMNFMGVGSRYNIDDVVKYKPEYSFNYELGSHLDLKKLSDSPLANLSVDLSLFYIDCRDQQLTTFPDGTTTGRMMTNAGKTRSFGGELSLVWNPWGPITFNGSYGYTNARFVKYFNGINDFAGKRLPYAPSNTLFLQCLYTLQTNGLGSKSLVFDLNVRGTGDIYWNEENTLKQPFYALLGAGITLKSPKWELQVWGRNLTATDYYTFYFMSISNEFLQRGSRINAGVTLRFFI